MSELLYRHERWALIPVCAGLVCASVLAGCAAPTRETGDAKTITYVDYSAYPKWDRRWGGALMDVDIDERKILVNDVKFTFELTEVDGWQVLRGQLLVLAAPASSSARSEITAGNRRFKRATIRDLRLFGVQTRAEEISIEDEKSGEEVGYVYYSPERGVVAMSYAEGTTWLMYILAGRCGVMAPPACR